MLQVFSVIFGSRQLASSISRSLLSTHLAVRCCMPPPHVFEHYNPTIKLNSELYKLHTYLCPLFVFPSGAVTQSGARLHQRGLGQYVAAPPFVHDFRVAVHRLARVRLVRLLRDVHLHAIVRNFTVPTTKTSII